MTIVLETFTPENFRYLTSDAGAHNDTTSQKNIFQQHIPNHQQRSVALLWYYVGVGMEWDLPDLRIFKCGLLGRQVRQVSRAGSAVVCEGALKLQLYAEPSLFHLAKIERRIESYNHFYKTPTSIPISLLLCSRARCTHREEVLRIPRVSKGSTILSAQVTLLKGDKSEFISGYVTLPQ